MWKVTVITSTPEIFPGPLGYSITGKALDDGLWSIDFIKIEKQKDKKKIKIDGPPAGGGPGMVLRADIIIPIIQQLRQSGDTRPLIIPAARGKKYQQNMAKEFVAGEGIIILCGRFEGIDQRIVQATNGIEISIGDFVLSNGDIAAINIIDSCVRLIDGVMNKKESKLSESFEDGLLEHPQFTLPREYDGYQIPDILLSGNHKKISEWRLAQSIETTKQNRPDLYQIHQDKSKK
ncbi:MAG: tRNA (guanosine(37)-N1)-methyltransferase TrmD [Hyphomicrobiales bacterium]|jgi:tRNA (guanine37-N1)-methyltransferase